MGSVYRRNNKLWIRYKGPNGKWTQSTTDYAVGEEKLARRLLADVEARISAGQEFDEQTKGPVTVKRFGECWIREREKLGLSDWKNDVSRLRHHVYPRIGDKRIDEVRPRDLVQLIKRLRTQAKLAPKTIYNVYSVLKALFRDAHLADLISATPCILTKHQLGTNEDKDLEWRPTALFTRDELEMLIADERIPLDRQVVYALEGIGGLRHGEVAGLCWHHYDASAEPLGSLLIARSYTKKPKTGRARKVPVHPTLAAVLANWKMSGWPAIVGRSPLPEDLVVPTSGDGQTPVGRMRNKKLLRQAFR